MPFIKIRVEVPITIEIDIDDEDEQLCGFGCNHWFDEPDHTRCRNTAHCALFGRLRWKDENDTFRHKKCLASRKMR